MKDGEVIMFEWLIIGWIVWWILSAVAKALWGGPTYEQRMDEKYRLQDERRSKWEAEHPEQAAASRAFRYEQSKRQGYY